MGPCRLDKDRISPITSVAEAHEGSVTCGSYTVSLEAPEPYNQIPKSPKNPKNPKIRGSIRTMYLDRRANLLHTAGEDGALRAWQLKAAPALRKKGGVWGFMFVEAMPSTGSVLRMASRRLSFQCIDIVYRIKTLYLLHVSGPMRH